jgi:Tol biopolymer transport system component
VEYVAPDYLIFERNRTLLAQPFDPDAGKLAGDPFPLTEGIGTGASGLAHFSGSSNGTLIYTSGDSPERQMAWFDRQGRELGIVGEPARMYNPALSADGRRVAVEIVDPRTDASDIWLIDLRRGARSRFTFDAANDERPVFSPDGSQIAFASNRDGDMDVFAKSTGGAGDATKVLDTDFRTYATFWLPGGKHMVLHGSRPDTGWDVISWDGDSPGDSIEVQIASRFVDGWPRVAPGGNYMSYCSNESGRFEVYLSTFPAGRGKWQVSLNGGADPQWRADGGELFFLTLDRRLMAVETSLDDGVEIGVPKQLFVAPVPRSMITGNRYVTSSDGERFLLLTLMDRGRVAPITTILNWTAELSER